MRFIDNINIEKYNNFVMNNKNCNLFQSPQWVEVKKEWDYRRVAVVENEEILATAQILIRNGLWYLPRGPILNYENAKLLKYFLENLKTYAKKNNAKLLKIDIPEPLKKGKINEFKNLAEDDKKEVIMSVFKEEKFKHKGFSLNMSDTIQPRFVAISELNEQYEDNLPKHTKRLIKDVEKRFVEVKKTNIEKLDDFMFALSCTEQRKNITLRKKEYFEELFRLYEENCILYTAYLNIKSALEKLETIKKEIEAEYISLKENMHKKKRALDERLESVNNLIKHFSELYSKTNKDVHVLCSAISVKYGISSEMLYAGMNDDFSKIPAQYQIYVETMKKFYEMGATHTSMGGVEGTFDDGLLKFKLHFNPHIVEYYGEFDYAINPVYKFMYDYGLPLRRKLLSIIKKCK